MWRNRLVLHADSILEQGFEALTLGTKQSLVITESNQSGREV